MSLINNQEITQILQSNLTINLKKCMPTHKIAEIYDYAVNPPGKMFRPFLSYATFFDFSNSFEIEKNYLHNSNLSLLSSAIELHHAYTLVHDDMPCMDNDDFRRNKESTHKKYGQWQALLVGDGLQNSSFYLLSKIIHPNLKNILNIFAYATGPKGLIQGQVLDLSEEMKKDFPTLIRTHELKTGRLIIVSILLSYLLIDRYKKNNNQYRTTRDLIKLGHNLGLIFQILDDLSELSDKDLSAHEKNINPWPKFTQECFATLKDSLEKLNGYFNKYQTTNIKYLVAQYLQKSRENILNNKEQIHFHLHNKIELQPIILLLNTLCESDKTI